MTFSEGGSKSFVCSRKDDKRSVLSAGQRRLAPPATAYLPGGNGSAAGGERRPQGSARASTRHGSSRVRDQGFVIRLEDMSPPSMPPPTTINSLSAPENRDYADVGITGTPFGARPPSRSIRAVVNDRSASIARVSSPSLPPTRPRPSTRDRQ